MFATLPPVIVAPHAGAWIETALPVKEKAIKMVAPHAGAWIETPPHGSFLPNVAVAPHAGAWIETLPGNPQGG